MDGPTLLAVVEDAFQNMLEQHFSADPGVNTALPIRTRAFREIDGWRSLLLLTPWMLARLLFPLKTLN